MKRTIETSAAPAAIGPYSQGVTYNGALVFTAGQIGMDPSTGEIVEGGIEAQTIQALNNLRLVLDAGKSSLGNALKVTIFLVDMNDFNTVNDIYKNFFSESQPARSAVQVSGLPKGALIEIECIAAAK